VEQTLRQRDLHLRNVLVNADSVVFQIAPDGTLVHIEGKALARIGLSPPEMIGRPMAELFGDTPSIMDGLARTLAGGQVNYIAEVRGLQASIMASPVFDEDGKDDRGIRRGHGRDRPHPGQEAPGRKRGTPVAHTSTPPTTGSSTGTCHRTRPT
jgi:PAS domain-containing protein